jgi:hypothetical protein
MCCMTLMMLAAYPGKVKDIRRTSMNGQSVTGYRRR